MNPILAAIPGSLIRALNALKRPGDIDLGMGEPTRKPDLRPFEAAMLRIAAQGCPYTPNAGDPALRLAIAERYACSPENVCVTVGSQEALWLAIKATLDPAEDELLVVSPSYPAYAKQAQLEGVACREVGLDPATGFAPDAARVLAAVGPQTRMLLLATPANPTGRVWPDDQLDALATGLLALGEARPWVLVDEVYREMVYLAPRPRPFRDRYDRTLATNSLSKSHALTGLRLGWLIAPSEITAAAVKAHQFVNTAASTFSQHVAHAILTDAAPLDAMRPHYEAQRGALLAQLNALGLAHVPPDGAFYCMIKLPEAWAMDSVACAHAFLEAERVVTVPGAAFGAEGWLRLSWVAPSEQLAAGLDRLARFLARPRD